jgi:hypothetical protein
MKWQGATLYWGKALAPYNELLPRGMQDAITPRSQTIRNLLVYAAIVSLLAYGFTYFSWYVPLSVLFGTLFCSGAIGLMLPKPESPYFQSRIRAQLVKRYRHYQTTGETREYDAMRGIIADFDSITV